MAGLTIIGAEPAAFPPQFSAPLLQTKKNWEDDWTFDFELEVESFSLYASSVKTDTCEFCRRYGLVKMPWETGLFTRTERNLRARWVRLMVATENGLTPMFVGRIWDDAQKLYGQSTTGIAAGEQRWQAQGGLRILEKIEAVRYDVFRRRPVLRGWDWPLLLVRALRM